MSRSVNKVTLNAPLRYRIGAWWRGRFPLPRPGTRVVTRRHGLDRYPHFLIRAGRQGVVREVARTRHGEVEVWVRMFAHVEGCEEWDNEVQVISNERGAREQFHAEFRRVRWHARWV